MEHERAADPGPVPAPKATRIIRAALLAHGPQSRAQLLTRTGLARSTVARVAQSLIDQGVVREISGPGAASSRGRPPVLLALNTAADLVGCLVLSHRDLRAAIVALDGTILASVDASVDPLDSTFDLVGRGEVMLRTASATLDETAIENLLGLALAVPGPYRPGVGLVGVQELAAQVRGAHGGRELPPWMTQDPGTELARRLGVPVVVENDANMAAIGEHTAGAASDARSAVVVTVFDGLVGAGLILNGKLFRGALGMAGEIAHVSVVENGPLCRCGRRGCLAAVLATTELSTPIDGEEPSLHLVDVFSRAAFGRPALLPALLDATRHIGKVLSDLCIWLNPETIVIQGLDAQVADRVVAMLETEIHARAGHLVGQATRVLASRLGEDARVLGGLALVRQHLAAQSDAD